MSQPLALLLALLAFLLAFAPSAFAQEPPSATAPAPAAPPAPPAPPGRPAPSEPTAPAIPVVSVPTVPNATCPIMGKPASLALFAETQHGRIYVCCTPCIVKIQRDPQRAYEAAYPLTHEVRNTRCPVSDAPLGPDAVSVVLQGHSIRVCPTCVEKARTHSQVTLAKALDETRRDVGNALCPVTGGAVAANAFCLVGSELIHLSSPKAVEQVRKDPLRYLEAARRNVVAGTSPPAR